MNMRPFRSGYLKAFISAHLSCQPQDKILKRIREWAIYMKNFMMLVVIVGFLSSLSGCSRFTSQKYSSFIRALDGKSELAVTTYPAGYPNRTSHIPFIYEELVSPNAVYFQVFVRDAVKKAGPNDHVESIRIHSFSVQFEDQPKIVLPSDYESNFWMQDQTRYNSLDIFPVPYYSDIPITVEIELTLNGIDYLFKGQMNPIKDVSTKPLFYKIYQ